MTQSTIITNTQQPSSDQSEALPAWWHFSLGQEKGLPVFFVDIHESIVVRLKSSGIDLPQTRLAREFLRQVGYCMRPDLTFMHDGKVLGFGGSLVELAECPTKGFVRYRYPVSSLLSNERFLATLYALLPVLDRDCQELLGGVATSGSQQVLLGVVPITGDMHITVELSHEVASYLRAQQPCGSGEVVLPTVREAMVGMLCFLDKTLAAIGADVPAGAVIYRDGLPSLDLGGGACLFATDDDRDVVGVGNGSITLYSKDVWGENQVLVFLAGIAEILRLARDWRQDKV